MSPKKSSHKDMPIYVVSGGRGLAGHTLLHSLLIQYPDHKLRVHIIPNVQNNKKIVQVVENVKAHNGLITHTMVNRDLRTALKKTCKQKGVKEIDFMGPVADFLEKKLGLKSVNVPGLYRRINAQYFERIEAIEFTMSHDDGLNTERLKKAEIILTGVSRSGKTPLSVYMSMFGWKVANVPLVFGIEPPKELFEVDPGRVFGLSIGMNHLISQRHKRLTYLSQNQNDDYVDEMKVRAEIQFANLIFEKGRFTKINVTNKPVETSANEIIGMISERFGSEKSGNAMDDEVIK